MNGHFNYLYFINEAMELACKLPEYFSHFLNKIYNNRQHFVLLLLKQELAVSYCKLVEYLEVMDKATDMLELKKIPHWL